MAGDKNEPPGFSEEALRGLHDFELRLPPPQPPDLAARPRPGLGGAPALLGPPRAAAPALPRRRPRRDAGVRAARAAALQRHRADRREAAGQGAARRLRRPQRRRRRLRAPADAGAGRHAQGLAAAPHRRGLRASHGAGEGHPALGDLVLGRADGLLPHGDGLPRHRAVPHPLPRPQERADRRRGAGQGHRRPRAGLSARGREARARAQRLGADPRAQPPLGRSDAERRRHRDDRARSSAPAARSASRCTITW